MNEENKHKCLFFSLVKMFQQVVGEETINIHNKVMILGY